MAANLFVYGSLMFPEIWESLVRSVYQSAPATLLGYKRTRIVGDCYPVIRPATHGDFVTGQIHWRVSDADLRRLDQFEGKLYRRRRVQVHALPMRRTPVQAIAYVLHDRYRHLASAQPWNGETARQACRLRFLENVKQQTNARHPGERLAHRMERS